MNNTYIWSFSLPLAVFLISIGLLLVARLKKWPVETAINDLLDEPPENIHAIEQSPIRNRINFFVTKYRWELILGATVGAILIFILIFAPPRSDGSIAIRPNTPGRPFYNLRWIRAFLDNYYTTILFWGSVSASILCLILLIWAILKRSGFGVQFLVLCASLNLAGVGQIFLHDETYRVSGKTFYLFALCGFSIWAWVARKRLAKDLEKKRKGRRVEWLLVFGLLLLTSFNRLYSLRTIPYGIEGDEAKWTFEAVNLGIRGIPDPTGKYHRDALPVSYYIQIPLHRLLRPSIFAARLTVAFLSIIGTLLFYWLLRQLSAIPVAAIATYLLSISIFDISASRLANVESFVKIWPILGLVLLALAARTRRWQFYGLSGLATALGILTYDTVWPLFVVASIIAVTELSRQKGNQITNMKSMAALIAPTLLVLPVLIPYATSRLFYYEFERKVLDYGLGSTVMEFFGTVIHTWFVAGNYDFIYNRPGPLLNAALLPLLVLGFVSVLFLIQKKISYWSLLWTGLFIFPVPILAHSPLGRVYYPALPAVYIIVALGIFVFWNETNRFFGTNFRPILIATAIVPLIWLPLANLFIYFNEAYDADDRLKRREIGELAAQAADEETLILLLAPPGADTPLNNEFQMVELFMLQKLPSNEIEKSYLYVAPEDLFSNIRSKATTYQKIEIIFDNNETRALAKTLQACFPQGELTEKYFFSRLSLSSTAVKQENCNFDVLTLAVKDNNSLTWELNDGKAQKLEMLCEIRKTGLEWIEAENIPMQNGWQIENNFASGWNGEGFAIDNYGAESLFIDLDIDLSQRSYIWVRYYKSASDESPAYLTINDITYPIANVSEADPNAWQWERIGPVKFDNRGKLSISRKYAGDPQSFVALLIDSLAITTDADFSPETDLWKPVPSKTISFEQPQSNGTVSLDFPQAFYRCRVFMETESPVLVSFGKMSSSLVSNSIEFEVK